MAEFYTPVQEGIGNPLAHFGEEVFNPVLADLQRAAYYQSGWYTLLDWVTLASSPASISITGISGEWRHLRFMGLFRGIQGAATDFLRMTVIPIASAYYFNSVELRGSVEYQTGAAQINIRIPANTAPAGFAPVLIDLYNYAEGNLLAVNFRGYAHSSNAASGMYTILGGCAQIRNEGPITGLSFSTLSSNIATGSMYALYGKDR